ncbi:MAG: hypothetical protein ACI8Z1_002852, partial [Candidatus Azotimanducaceae bacterium]
WENLSQYFAARNNADDPKHFACSKDAGKISRNISLRETMLTILSTLPVAKMLGKSLAIFRCAKQC